MNQPKFKHDLFFLFDVESIGLHGEGFAVGFVVFKVSDHHIQSTELTTLDKGVYCCMPGNAWGSYKGREWVNDNVPWPQMRMEYGDLVSPLEVRQRFWEKLMDWKAKGATMAADVPWPVEARFLASCVDDHKEHRNWDGPYPLIDVASLAVMHDTNAGVCTFPENLEKNETLVAHHPLDDAKTSALKLIHYLYSV